MPPSGHGIGHLVGGSGKGNTVGVRYREQPGHGRGPKTWLAGPVSEPRWAHGIETVIVHYALNGHRIPAQGIALGTASTESVCSEGTPHRKGGVEAQDTRPMRRSFRTRVSFSGWIPRVGTLGWYAMPPSGHEIGHVVGGSGNGNTVGVRYRNHGGPTGSKLLSSHMP